MLRNPLCRAPPAWQVQAGWLKAEVADREEADKADRAEAEEAGVDAAQTTASSTVDGSGGVSGVDSVGGVGSGSGVGGDAGDVGGGVGDVGGGSGVELTGEDEVVAAPAVEPKKADTPRLLDNVTDISDEEVKNFKRVALYMKPNPRSIKRISSIYLLSRLIVRKRCLPWKGKEKENELLRRLLVWIVLCEQWPVHVAWSLQVLEDLQQRHHLQKMQQRRHPGNEGQWKVLINPNELSFEDFYHTHVKHIVFNVEPDHCPKPLRQRYQRAFALDHDTELFDCLIADDLDAGFELKVEHIGKLQSREPKMLISYCINLNPALTSLLARVKAVPRSAVAEKRVKELVNDWNPSSMDAHRTKPPKAEAGGMLTKQVGTTASPDHVPAHGTTKAIRTPASVDYVTVYDYGHPFQSNKHSEPSQAEGKDKETHDVKAMIMRESKDNNVRALPDDKTGRDHVGYSDYAMCLSSLIFAGLDTPCVIGIYAQWGTGKSFIMEKIKVALKALQLERVLVDQGVGADAYADNLRELIESDEDQVTLMFTWVQMGMPQLPHEAFQNEKGKPGRRGTLVCHTPSRLVKLNPDYFASRNTADQQLDTTALWLLCLLLVRIVIAVFKLVFKPLTWLLELACSECIEPKVDPHQAPMLFRLMQAGKKERKKKSSATFPLSLFLQLWAFRCCSKQAEEPGKGGQVPTTFHEYHYIWWNAWLYAGSDNLWAGLIQALHEAVEEKYGAPYVRCFISHTPQARIV